MMNSLFSASVARRGALGKAVLIGAAALLVGAFIWMNQSSPAQELINTGKNLARTGRMPEAIAVWNQAVQRDPNAWEAWEQLGEYYQSIGDYTAAVEPYRRLAALKPDHPGVYRHLGASSVQTANQDALYQQALQVLQKNPDSVPELVIAASILTYRDDQKRHLDYLRRLVRLRPRDVDALATLCQALTNAHLYDEARPHIERLVELAPDNPAAYDFRGRIRLKAARSPEELRAAEADLQKALALKAPTPLPYLYLGQAAIRLQEPEKAVIALEEAQRRMPARPEVYFALANAYDLAGQRQKAAATRAKFVELRNLDDRQVTLQRRCLADPNHFENHLEVGLIFLRKGDFDKAGYYLNRAAALRPQEARAREALLQLQAATGGAGPQVPGLPPGALPSTTGMSPSGGGS